MKSLVAHLFEFLVAVLLVLLVFKVFDIDLSIPLNYSGDALVHYNFAQNIQFTGWWPINPHLGSPLIQDLNDFPLSENLYLLMLKALMLLGLDWVLSVNIFYILTFPLTVLTSMYVFRKLNISYFVGLPLAVVYSFLPYHFYRGVNHLFLSAYFVLPLAIYLALKIASVDIKKTKELVLISLLVGSIGAYYTFFSLIFLCLAVVIGLINLGKWERTYILKSLVLVGIVLFSFLVNLSPSLYYNFKHGTNLNSVVRAPNDTETFGLRISQLLVPVPEHNFNLFKKIRIRYDTYGVPNLYNETQYSSLGLITSIGFIFLVIIGLMFPGLLKTLKITTEKTKLITTLGLFNLVAIAFSTIGGFGLLMSVYLNPVFRSINRISIFIAFFSLICLGLLLDSFIKNFKVKLILLLLIPLALYDQISPAVMQNFSNTQENYLNYRYFSKEITQNIGHNKSVFTLPFSQYPEGSDKNLMRIALLADTLTFSTGASKWRSANNWQYETLLLPKEEMLTAIVVEGFDGLLVYVPEYFPDDLKEIEYFVGSPTVIDATQKYYFYNLEDFKTKNTIAEDQSEFFYSISGNCINNFSEEKLASLKYWCVDKAYVVVENVTNNSLTLDLRLNISTPELENRQYAERISLNPGVTKINISEIVHTKGIFPKPFKEISWPSVLGYPNIIINEIKIEEIK